MNSCKTLFGRMSSSIYASVMKMKIIYVIMLISDSRNLVMSFSKSYTKNEITVGIRMLIET